MSEQPKRKKNVVFDDDEVVHHDESNWLVSYADLMTLLMGFFILMYSMSNKDEAKFNSVSKKVAKYFGGAIEEDPRLKNTFANLKGVFEVKGLENTADVEIKDGKIKVKFNSQILFYSGNAVLIEDALSVIDKVGATLAAVEGVEEIVVKGHTDSVPINSKLFPSNWELSSARASTIVRRLSKVGINESSFKVLGMAGNEPIAPNKNAAGEYIKENLIKNRRVEIEVKLARNKNIPVLKDKSLFSFLSSGSGEDREPGSESPVDIGADDNAGEDSEIKLEDLEEKFQKAKKDLKETTLKLRKVQSFNKEKKKILKFLMKIKEMERKAKESEDKIKDLTQ